MKFKDINPFIKDGTYQVNYSLKSLVNWINEQEQEYNLQLNPDFQRGHVWTKEQQISWLEFFIRGWKTGNILYFNDPYWLTWNHNNTGYNDFVCVDGLQRITTIQMFINNEIPVFGAFYKEFEDPKWLNNNRTIMVNVNTLKTKNDVLKWYIDMNSGGTPHSKEEIERVKKMIIIEKVLPHSRDFSHE